MRRNLRQVAREQGRQNTHREGHRRQACKIEWSISITLAVMVASICIGYLQHQCAPVFRAETEKNISEYLETAVEQTMTETEGAEPYQEILRETRDADGNLTALTLNVEKASALSKQLRAALEKSGMDRLE